MICTVVIGTCSYNPNYHTITTTTGPKSKKYREYKKNREYNRIKGQTMICTIIQRKLMLITYICLSLLLRSRGSHPRVVSVSAITCFMTLPCLHVFITALKCSLLFPRKIDVPAYLPYDIYLLYTGDQHDFHIR